MSAAKLPFAQRVLLWALAGMGVACAGTQENEPPLEAAPPTMAHASTPHLAVAGCSFEREVLESIHVGYLPADDHEKPRKPSRKGEGKSRPPRAVTMIDHLSDDFILEALVLYVDRVPAFVGTSANAMHSTPLVVLDDATHVLTARALVRRRLEGGFYEYVSECSNLTSEGIAPARPVAVPSRRRAPEEDSPSLSLEISSTVRDAMLSWNGVVEVEEPY